MTPIVSNIRQRTNVHAPRTRMRARTRICASINNMHRRTQAHTRARSRTSTTRAHERTQARTQAHEHKHFTKLHFLTAPSTASRAAVVSGTIGQFIGRNALAAQDIITKTGNYALGTDNMSWREQNNGVRDAPWNPQPMFRPSADTLRDSTSIRRPIGGGGALVVPGTGDLQNGLRYDLI